MRTSPVSISRSPARRPHVGRSHAQNCASSDGDAITASISPELWSRAAAEGILGGLGRAPRLGPSYISRSGEQISRTPLAPSASASAATRQVAQLDGVEGARDEHVGRFDVAVEEVVVVEVAKAGGDAARDGEDLGGRKVTRLRRREVLALVEERVERAVAELEREAELASGARCAARKR